MTEKEKMLTGELYSANVSLRPVAETDLPILYEQQLDEEACRVAAFKPRKRKAFMAHWRKILRDDNSVTRTIVADGAVAGHIASFVMSGVRQVGYWIGREFWNRGIATAALRALLAEEERRPLHAYVARENVASIRVLEKCGFVTVGEHDDGDVIEQIMRCD